MLSWRALPTTSQPWAPAMVSATSPALGVHPAAVDRVGQYVVDVHQFGRAERVVRLQSGEVDDLGDEVGQPGRFDAHPGGETTDRGRIVGRLLHRLGQQGQRADRRLELVTDVGHEVPAGLLDPPGRRLVLGQQQHLLVGQRCDPDVEVGGRVPGPRQVEVLNLTALLAPDLADQVEDRGDGHPAAAYHPEGLRQARRLQHLVVGTDDRAGAAQRVQHLRHAVGHDGAIDLDRDGRRAVGPAPQQHPGRYEADHDAQQPRDHPETSRVHTSDSRVSAAPALTGTDCACGTCGPSVPLLFTGR